MSNQFSDRADFPLNDSDDPDHIVRIADSEWCLWRWVGLRGAGFPFSGIFKLAAPVCAAHADRLIAAEKQAEALLQGAIEALSHAIVNADEADRALLMRARKQLKKGKLPDQPLPFSQISNAVERFAAASHAIASLRVDYQRNFELALVANSQAVREIASSDRFREAIAWQNHGALHSGLDPILRKQATEFRDSKDRRNEELVATYWQRYCTKNDTIGYFGPVGWCRIGGEERITVKCGKELVRGRRVYFETWCIDGIAEAINREEGIKRWIAPVVVPGVRIEGEEVEIEGRGRKKLSEREKVVMKECDGERTAEEVARRVIGEREVGIESEEEVLRILEEKEKEGIIGWKMRVPASSEPEKYLREKLKKIGDDKVREKWERELEGLEEARRKIREGAGVAERVDEGMHEIEEKYREVTGGEAKRMAGKTYAGRTLVYEDCVRDIEVELGEVMVEEMGEALSLLLKSGRWLTHRAAERWREELEGVYEEMREETGKERIGAAQYWGRAQKRLFGGGLRTGGELEKEFERRWGEVLGVAEGREARYRSEELRERVDELFEAPGAGWELGRYHSPDIMIAADGVEAIRRGDYLFVLGELHVAINSMRTAMFVYQHPRSEELFRGLEHDLRRPCLVPVVPKDRLTQRGIVALVSPRDYFLEIAANSPSPSASQVLRLGSLVIERKNGELVVRSMDGKVEFDIVEAFGELLTAQIVNSCHIAPAVPHTPRIIIDRLVVSRESWRFAAGTLEFAFEKSEMLRFVRARKWAESAGLPRFVFVKTPVEVKPCFVDFESPILISVFARQVRRSREHREDSNVTISEMLPRPDELWLSDIEGNRYTSELRLAAIDYNLG